MKFLPRRNRSISPRWPEFEPTCDFSVCLFDEVGLTSSNIDSVGSPTGNGASASGGGRPQYETDVFRSLPGANFDGSADFMTLDTPWAPSGAFSLFCLLDVTALNFALLTEGTNGSTHSILVNGSGDVILRVSGSPTTVASAAVSTGKQLIEIHRSGSDVISVFINGVDVTAAGPPSKAGTPSLATIGGSASFPNITLGVLVGINSALSSDEIAKFRTMLRETANV